ncbi:MAG: hypothetical protein JNK60_07250 [Acidobacteria bacterium]|nr:hypothetical protein [Acidobacteriota bacterium]
MKQPLVLLAAMLLAGCSRSRAPEPPALVATAMPFTVSWLSGHARFGRLLEEPTFGVKVRVSATDFGAVASALGTNSPCFKLAVVERCANVEGEAVPLGVARSPGNSLGEPIWCPVPGVAVEWTAAFTDYRRVIGHPGVDYHPLKTCRGPASAALFLVPSGLVRNADTLPRPGLPLKGIPVTGWTSL